MIKRTIGSMVALCLCGLAATTDVRAQEREVIRESLFTTCTAADGRRWIVGELGRVFSTPDLGKTVERVDLNTREAFLAIACSPDGTLLITGQHGLVMRSRDGGKSWQKLDVGTDRTLLSARYLDANTVIAVGDFGTVVRSADGGESWTKIPLPTELSLPEDIAEIIEPGDILLYGVDFPTPTDGWIAGEFGTILVTHDAGLTWTAQETPEETTLFAISFADTQRGWAVGIEEVMLHTEDGGQTWERQRVPSRPGFVLGIYGVDVAGNYGWAAGDNGLLLRTTDGGRTWERVDLPIQFAADWLRDVDLGENGEGLIVGGSGLMIRTKNDQYENLGQ